MPASGGLCEPHACGEDHGFTSARFAAAGISCRALVILLLLLLSLAVSQARPVLAEEPLLPWHEISEEGEVRVNLYVFWSASCPHCHRVLRFLQTLKQDLEWLEVQPLEVSVPENAALYMAIAERLGTDARYVPAFFFCGRSIQGYDRDQTTGQVLRQSLEACRAQLLDRIRASQSVGNAEVGAVSNEPPVHLPVVGQVDPSRFSLPIITMILAGLDAFNPCAFFVLLFLLSLLVHAQSRTRMALVGGVFVLFSGVLYFGFMAAWLNLFLVLGYIPLVTIGAGIAALIIGAVAVKDFIWLKRGVTLSIPERVKPQLYDRARRLYVLPLLMIVCAFVISLGARKLTKEEGRTLKLLSGLMMLSLGAVLLIYPQALNSPLTGVSLMLMAITVTALVKVAQRFVGRRSRA